MTDQELRNYIKDTIDFCNWKRDKDLENETKGSLRYHTILAFYAGRIESMRWLLINLDCESTAKRTLSKEGK